MMQPGVVFSRSMVAQEPHRYSVALGEGQACDVVVLQRGIDLLLTITAPDGATLVEGSNDSGAYGPESFVIVAEQGGRYGITVAPLYRGALAGAYDVRVGTPRSATAADRRRHRAERSMAKVRRLAYERSSASLLAAVPELEGAIAIWRSLGDHEQLCSALTLLGTVRKVLGDAAAGRALWREAAEIAAREGLAREECKARASLGTDLLAKGDPAAAFESLSAALSLARRAGDRRQEASVEIQWAAFHDELGEAQVSLDHYRRALDLARDARDVQLEALARMRIGMGYSQLGHYRKALDHYREAQPKVEAVRGVGFRGSLQANMGVAYWGLGDDEQALVHLGEALRLHREAGSRAGEAQVLAQLGRIHAQAGRLDAALDHFMRASTLATELKYAIGVAAGLQDLGEVFFARGDIDEAGRRHAQALAMRRDLQDPVGEARALLGLARVEERRGHLAEAAAHARSSVKLLEIHRGKLAEETVRASYLALVRRGYELAVRVLVRLHRERPGEGHDREALAVSERGRARVLLDSLAESLAAVRGAVDPALLEREGAVRRELALHALRAARLGPGANAEERRALDETLQRLLSQHDLVWAEMRRRFPEHAALLRPEPLELEGVRGLLDADTLLLEYMLGEESSVLFAVSRDGLAAFELPPKDLIEKQARRLYQLLTARRDRPRFETADERSRRVARADAEYAVLAGELSETLLAPVARQLSRRCLIVVPDGALNFVPFGALLEPRDAGRHESGPHSPVALPLMARHEITHAPSASAIEILRAQASRRAPAARTVMILADPVFDVDDPRVRRRPAGAPAAQPGRAEDADAGLRALENGLVRTAIAERAGEGLGLDRLPSTRREAQSILALVPAGAARSAFDFEASRAAALDPSMADFRIVHLATHGYLDSREPRLSSLVFSLVDEEGLPQDGFLRLPDVYEMKLNADLVVLSACETALGEEIGGEGLVSLSRGFMYAGAQRVLATLWRVDDEATAELMRHLYSALLRDRVRPSEALRRAQQAVASRAEWRAPYYWAGFTLQGEPR